MARDLSRPVHANAFSFENADISIRLRLSSTLIRSKNAYRYLKTLLRVKANLKRIPIVVFWKVVENDNVNRIESLVILRH